MVRYCLQEKSIPCPHYQMPPIAADSNPMWKVAIGMLILLAALGALIALGG